MGQAVGVWIDNHCHLPVGPEAADAVAEARAWGVTRLIDVGTSVAHSAEAINRASRFEGVWATAGVHPHDASNGIIGLAELARSPEVVAIGECGLDYHYLHSPATAQKEVFALQIRLAHELDLALVIHTRDAWSDTFDILGDEAVPPRTVFHCFTGGPDEARRCLDLGAVLSFSGIVTFPSAADVREAAAMCPSGRFLIETDAPYLAPVPHRGRPNRPALVTVVGAAVSAARGEAVESVAAETWATASELYRLDVANST